MNEVLKEYLKINDKFQLHQETNCLPERKAEASWHLSPIIKLCLIEPKILLIKVAGVVWSPPEATPESNLLKWNGIKTSMESHKSKK